MKRRENHDTPAGIEDAEERGDERGARCHEQRDTLTRKGHRATRLTVGEQRLGDASCVFIDPPERVLTSMIEDRDALLACEPMPPGEEGRAWQAHVRSAQLGRGNHGVFGICRPIG